MAVWKDGCLACLGYLVGCLAGLIGCLGNLAVVDYLGFGLGCVGVALRALVALAGVFSVTLKYSLSCWLGTILFLVLALGLWFGSLVLVLARLVLVWVGI